MKKLVTFIAIICCFGCNTESTKEESPQKRKDTVQTTDDTIAIKGDVIEWKTVLTLYSKGYSLQINFSLDSLRYYNEAKILLTQKEEIVFNKTISIDTLEQSIMKNELLKDSLGKHGYLSDYFLNDVTYKFVRAEHLYFTAELHAKKINKKLYVLFQLDYLKNPGKLFVNGLSEEAY